ALVRVSGGRDRRPILEAAWRTLIRTQFHDTIAGCTADSVAAAAEHRLTEVAAYAAELTRGALMDLAGHDPDVQRERTDGTAPGLVLWNPAVRARGGVTVTDITVFRRNVLVGPPSEGLARRCPARAARKCASAAARWKIGSLRSRSSGMAPSRCTTAGAMSAMETCYAWRMAAMRATPTVTARRCAIASSPAAALSPCAGLREVHWSPRWRRGGRLCAEATRASSRGGSRAVRSFVSLSMSTIATAITACALAS